MKLDAQSKPFDTLVQVVDKLSVSQQAQTNVLQEWMAGFKVTDLPTSSVVRDEDEYIAEQDRARGQLNPAIEESIQNAFRARALPQLADLLHQEPPNF